MADSAVVDHYVQALLPTKLALDRIYLQRATLLYDIRVIVRTIAGIAARSLGTRNFPVPPELREAEATVLPVSARSHASRL
jgi:hypothetical protein